MTKDFSQAVFERAAKDPEFAGELQRKIGAQIARADKAEAQQQKEFWEAVEIIYNKTAKIECLEVQIAEAVRECVHLARMQINRSGSRQDYGAGWNNGIQVATSDIKRRWPEYFKEGT